MKNYCLTKNNLIATNSRVIGRVCQSVSSEPYGSNFGWFAFWRDRSDPAAHGKHYGQK